MITTLQLALTLHQSEPASRPFGIRNLSVPIFTIQRQLHRLEENLDEVRCYFIEEKYGMHSSGEGGRGGAMSTALTEGSGRRVKAGSGAAAVSNVPQQLEPARSPVRTEYRNTRFLRPVNLSESSMHAPADHEMSAPPYSSSAPLTLTALHGQQTVSRTSAVDAVTVSNATETQSITINTVPNANDDRSLDGYDDGGDRSIQIDGEELTFMKSDVPDFPHGLNYSGMRLSSLFVQWYEADASPVKIKGRGIPIRHLPLVYATRAGNRKHTWASHRSTWSNWKVSAPSRQGSPVCQY